ncbi:MAG: acylphosphatase [Pirellulales bacterium]|nr:acylphosphatase [Pirellulales bacterium]
MSDSVERREVYFSGRVQGVGFRYTTRRVAERFRVTGFVENLPDGRVHAVVEGNASEIDRFLSAVESELRGCITAKKQTSLDPIGEANSFEIRF